jgi:hypothetical protein
MVDVPPSFSSLFEMPHWADLTRDPVWSGATDILAIDTYPNFVFAQPVRDDIVASRVREAVSLAGGRPVWVAETGIAVAHNSSLHGVSTVPATNFTEVNQADYFGRAFDAAMAEGATGFFVFGWWRDPGIVPPSGGYDAEDQEAAMAVADLYLNGTDAIPSFLEFVSGHLEYSATRLPVLLADSSSHWGVWNGTSDSADAVPLLAARVLEERFSQV